MPHNRRHIPPLSREQLTILFKGLEQIPIGPVAKKIVRDVMAVAANPKSQQVRTVVASLVAEDRENIEAAEKKIRRVMFAAINRLTDVLVEDKEFARLVKEESEASE